MRNVKLERSVDYLGGEVKQQHEKRENKVLELEKEVKGKDICITTLTKMLAEVILPQNT